METLPNTFGCDSLIITTTTFSESDMTMIDLTSCDPDDVGVDIQNLINILGCDSIVTTTTTLLPSDTTELFANPPESLRAYLG